LTPGVHQAGKRCTAVYCRGLGWEEVYCRELGPGTDLGFYNTYFLMREFYIFDYKEKKNITIFKPNI